MSFSAIKYCGVLLSLLLSAVLACAQTVSGGANTVYFWRLQNHLS